MLLKKRNSEKRLYEGYQELIFSAGKNPSIESLTKAVKECLKVSDEEELKIIKYIHYNFEWVEICER